MQIKHIKKSQKKGGEHSAPLALSKFGIQPPIFCVSRLSSASAAYLLPPPPIPGFPPISPPPPIPPLPIIIPWIVVVAVTLAMVDPLAVTA
jgi:hypothetical protein